MKQDILKQAVAEVRDKTINPAVMEAAADRVRARILAPSNYETNLHQIWGCGDFRTLIPAYLDGSLSPARRMLLEDHTYSCLPCRHAIDFARTGKSPVLRRPMVVDSDLAPHWKAAIAAMVAVTVGLSGWGLYRLVAPGRTADANVKTVSGTLFAVSDASRDVIFAGFSVRDRQHVRTREGSEALLRLADGSEVELNARTEIWFDRAFRDTTIHLTRGSIIVHAAKQLNGALHVTTADCRVSVKGTIFAVSSGLKGSRVSVVEGAVRMDQGAQTRLLRPGQQGTTSTILQPTSVSDEIAWSRDSAKYLALLGEISAIANQLAKVPEPGLRYNSKLAELAPENTVIYAAIPNLGPLVSEANRLFDDRLNQSPVLSQWWNTHQPQNGPSLDDVLQRVRTFSDYLGGEISLAITLDRDTKSAVPLVMAEVTRPGLSAFLAAQADQINSDAQKGVFRVLDTLPSSDASSVGHQPGSQMLAYISGNHLFVSTSLNLLTQVNETAKGHGSRGAYPLYPRIQQAYRSGAGWLLAADMEQIRATSVNQQEAESEMRRQMAAAGVDNLNAVVLERKVLGGVTQATASLGFSGNRSGMAGWLAAPAPMGSLDFVSPAASMATAAVMKDHGAVIWDLLNSIEASHPEAAAHVKEFQDNAGYPILAALANSLGADFTFAIDGPLVPVPSWKLAVEVYNSSNFEWAIEQLISNVNQQPDAKVKLNLAKAESGGHTIYTITADKVPVQINYTFVDHYLVAAATRDLLMRAMQNRVTGYTLSRSENFRAQLPTDDRTDFSALLYFNAGPTLAAVSQQLNASNALTPEQKNAIAAFATAGKPGLVYAYGEPDRILVSSTGSFFGLSIDTVSIPAVLSATMRNQFKTETKPN